MQLRKATLKQHIDKPLTRTTDTIKPDSLNCCFCADFAVMSDQWLAIPSKGNTLHTRCALLN